MLHYRETETELNNQSCGEVNRKAALILIFVGNEALSFLALFSSHWVYIVIRFDCRGLYYGETTFLPGQYCMVQLFFCRVSRNLVKVKDTKLTVNDCGGFLRAF